MIQGPLPSCLSLRNPGAVTPVVGVFLLLLWVAVCFVLAFFCASQIPACVITSLHIPWGPSMQFASPAPAEGVWGCRECCSPEVAALQVCELLERCS